MSRTQKQKESAMIEFIVLAFWSVFGAYSTWFLGKAKQNVTLSPREAYILWSIHKRETGCNSPTYLHITHKKGIIGFKCQCGHNYLSKRPIV